MLRSRTSGPVADYGARRRPRSRLRRVITVAATLVATAALLTATEQSAAAQDPAVEPLPSPGCAAPAPASGGSMLGFAAPGKSGSYIRDLPPGADHPLPLVLDLHGYLEPALLEHDSTGFGAYGMSQGFITITPQLDEPGVPRWDFGEGSLDSDYLSQLLTHVESTVCVDTRRVYVTGLSMGGFTTSSLGCQFSERIAAIAPVAGLQDFEWCRTSRPVPVIAFHGTADPIVAYEGGLGPNARLLPSPDGTGSADRGAGAEPEVNGPGPQSITANAAAWARRNGCDGGDPAEVWVAPDVALRSYPCPARGEVQLYSLIGAGHVWPGTSAAYFPAPLVGANTTSIQATRVIWEFFRAHPMRG
ncbi:alpha/beta hydrolase family esterase [Nocardia arizonensis]|uniref:alpha/beta hydrolase family esterase n=1 Tax=Nocardia arizonensis TaxID=1141647 RepID=UPI000B2BCDC6|nr:hypothetical protein [Nocardia arizonensis]